MGFENVVTQVVLFLVIGGVMVAVVSHFGGVVKETKVSLEEEKEEVKKEIKTRIHIDSFYFHDQGANDKILIYVRNTGNTKQETGCITLYINSTPIDLNAQDITYPDNETPKSLWKPGEVIRINATGKINLFDGTTKEVKVITCDGVWDTYIEEVPSTTTTTLPTGQSCTTSEDCATGYCVDNVCCNTPCSGLCEACNLTGSEGTCTYIPYGEDPDNECAGCLTCNGAGGCTTCCYVDPLAACGDFEDDCSSTLSSGENIVSLNVSECNYTNDMSCFNTCACPAGTEGMQLRISVDTEECCDILALNGTDFSGDDAESGSWYSVTAQGCLTDGQGAYFNCSDAKISLSFYTDGSTSYNEGETFLTGILIDRIKCITCPHCQVWVEDTQPWDCEYVANGSDPRGDCGNENCSDYVYGWGAGGAANTSCVRMNYTHDGVCDGAGNCQTHFIACQDATPYYGPEGVLATCGDEGCKNYSACQFQDLAVNNDELSEICYLDNEQHGCPENYRCSPIDGSCICNPNYEPCPENRYCCSGYCDNNTLSNDTEICALNAMDACDHIVGATACDGHTCWNDTWLWNDNSTPIQKGAWGGTNDVYYPYCCGDDSSEFYRNSSMDGHGTGGTWERNACCNAATDCVESDGTCETATGDDQACSDVTPGYWCTNGFWNSTYDATETICECVDLDTTDDNCATDGENNCYDYNSQKSGEYCCWNTTTDNWCSFDDVSNSNYQAICSAGVWYNQSIDQLTNPDFCECHIDGTHDPNSGVIDWECDADSEAECFDSNAGLPPTGHNESRCCADLNDNWCQNSTHSDEYCYHGVWYIRSIDENTNYGADSCECYIAGYNTPDGAVTIECDSDADTQCYDSDSGEPNGYRCCVDSDDNWCHDTGTDEYCRAGDWHKVSIDGSGVDSADACECYISDTNTPDGAVTIECDTNETGCYDSTGSSTATGSQHCCVDSDDNWCQDGDSNEYCYGGAWYVYPWDSEGAGAGSQDAWERACLCKLGDDLTLGSKDCDTDGEAGCWDVEGADGTHGRCCFEASDSWCNGAGPLSDNS